MYEIEVGNTDANSGSNCCRFVPFIIAAVAKLCPPLVLILIYVSTVPVLLSFHEILIWRLFPSDAAIPLLIVVSESLELLRLILSANVLPASLFTFCYLPLLPRI
jgi:hypothetical protein